MTRINRHITKIKDASFGFGTWLNPHLVIDESFHAHPDIELNYFLVGPVRYLIGGHLQEVPSCRLIMFWAGLPHRAVECPPECPPDCATGWTVHIPIAQFTQWQLGEKMVQYLLDGHVVMAPAGGPEQIAFDKMQLTRWATEFAGKDPDARRILTLEIEAVVLRLARTGSITLGSGHTEPITEGGAMHIERACRFIAEHYTEGISTSRIADALQLHPKYLMKLFKEHCGVSLREYLLRMCVSHAQQLLIRTDLKVTEIAFESGFGSICHFHKAFEHYSGCTPRHYRVNMRGESEQRALA